MRHKKDKRSSSNNLHLDIQSITPKTPNQEAVFDAYEDFNLILLGSAGTGKSFLSMYLGLHDVLEEKMYDRVMIIRSAVSSRDQGFLPGTEDEKMSVYEAPYEAICNELFKRGDAYSVLKTKRIVEFVSTSYLRGITIDNTVIIVDEIQNMSPAELNTIMTRVGENTKIIFSGDTRQSDMLKDKYDFMKFVDLISKMNEFKTITFTVDDIVRSGIVRQYLTLKEKLKIDF